MRQPPYFRLLNQQFRRLHSLNPKAKNKPLKFSIRKLKYLKYIRKLKLAIIVVTRAVFLKDTLPRISSKMNVIVNISGSSVEEYGELAKLLDVDGVKAVELNISCPNVKDGGIVFGTDPKAAAQVTQEAKKSTSKPVIVKLSPNVTDIKLMARAVEDAGADCISLINTLIGMEININTWRPTLGNVTGGLSGGAIKPVALRMVYEVAKTVKVPVIGMGGIYSWQDAVEFFLAGASAIAVGTANFTDPSITMKIADGLENYLQSRNLTHISQIIGKISTQN